MQLSLQSDVISENHHGWIIKYFRPKFSFKAVIIIAVVIIITMMIIKISVLIIIIIIITYRIQLLILEL